MDDMNRDKFPAKISLDIDFDSFGSIKLNETMSSFCKFLKDIYSIENNYQIYWFIYDFEIH